MLEKVALLSSAHLGLRTKAASFSGGKDTVKSDFRLVTLTQRLYSRNNDFKASSISHFIVYVEINKLFSKEISIYYRFL